ncbi:type II toxin-antitoxin system ParD family antitoxin [Pseudothauera rhizosphaerae]|uniref:Type II toxin-antitoxin system ParD family antitoxin n=1 Tax=Pseudothauera rhizosphaerae TaxID=2565932 RepID=A0A4S4AVP0_9RHOO|nr:type II toxin-antitoxin system ParD family antitoxin [Pseudothauera rhizosphaerae]THF62616.1 type II toxin-antitoxin system ParD family antitoxin [Pseudothauera rhizosphaerae]
MATITIDLPDDIAEQARRAGLLSARVICGLLEDTLRERSGDIGIKALRAALIEGKNSGKPRPFDFERFLQEKRRAAEAQ